MVKFLALILSLFFSSFFIFPSPALAVCSCAPQADYGDPTNKTAWCACAASCGDSGSLINGNCPQAPTSNTCQANCSYCAVQNPDRCGNKTYNTCDYSTCRTAGANARTQYKCWSDVNPNCEGYYYCGSLCAPSPTPTPRPTPTATPKPSLFPSPSSFSPRPTSQPTQTPTSKPTPFSQPITISSIVINGKNIEPKNGSSLRMSLPINDTTKEASSIVPITVNYSNGTGKTYFVNFKYQPKQLPQSAETKTVKVLSLKYFPLDSSGSRLDFQTTNVDSDLTSIRAHIDNITRQGMDKLTQGSRYHGYKTNSLPGLKYELIQTFEYLEPLPLSQNRVPWSNTGSVRPDYNQVLNRINICDWVDNKGVSQVWLWGYHTKSLEPTESNMAMGTNSRTFWNGDSFGDVSNSERIQDMPVCQKTYILYNYNYQRGLGELLENHGHHIEAVLGFIDNDFFWNRFVNPHGEKNGINRCGWMHSPPNSTNQLSGTGIITPGGQYDWVNETPVQSDCEDWKPDKIGVIKTVNCHAWYGDTCPALQDYSTIAADWGAKFKIWWMQNLPGLDNNLNLNGQVLRNWWDFYADFDAALAKGKSLAITTTSASGQSSAKIQTAESTFLAPKYVPPASLPHPSPTPTPTPTPSQAVQVNPYDLNSDGDINSFDAGQFLTAWRIGSEKIDFNDDGVQNSIDYAILKNSFQ